MRRDCGLVLVTKDALCKDYLPVYGNKYWRGKTPNIDELANKGTVFDRHITAAPSTVMAFRAMVTGLYAHEQPYQNYTPKEVPGSDTDLFEMAKSRGYSGHIVWDAAWDQMVLRYGNCYGPDTTIHSIPEIRQGVGCHYNHSEPLRNDDAKSRATIDRLFQEIENIVLKDAKVLLWIHLPHVINGRTSYGGDIDLFDEVIGRLRGLFLDENIFISADHGNMNGHREKYCYGFDVNASAIEIPLITPRLMGVDRYKGLTSNVDIKTIILDRIITKRECVFSDCAYYAQPHRKLAIYSGNFAYLFNKLDGSEELYDMANDGLQLHNLLQPIVYDPDRKITSLVREYCFSPYWDEAEAIADEFREIKKAIWKTAPLAIELKEKYENKLKYFGVKVLRLFKK